MGRVIFYAILFLLGIGGIAVLAYLAYISGLVAGKRKTLIELRGETPNYTRHREALLNRAESLFESLTAPPERFDVQATFLTPEHHQEVRRWRADHTRLEKK